MAGIRLEWAQFGDFDSFDVIRSDAPMDINALPSPIATNLPTMYHVDTTVVDGATYYYRVVAWRDGVSKVSGEIQVKASDGDEHWDKVVALLHFDGDLTDETGRIWQLRGDAVSSSDEYAFGGSSLFVPRGTRNGLFHGGSADFALATDDYTIEFFAYFLDGGDRVALEIGTASGWYGRFWIDSHKGKLRVAGGPSVTIWIHNGNIPINSWVHIAVTIQAGQLFGFLNGQLVGSANVSGQLPAGNLAVGIGHVLPQTNPTNMYGYIDELRITKGVARYTANFTPPNAPFPSY